MACSNVKIAPARDYKTTGRLIKFPCRCCVNCMIDATTYYEDLCSNTAYDYDYVMSFVTLTCDDYHQKWVPRLDLDVPDFTQTEFTYYYQMSVDRSAPQKFMKRVRAYMKRKKIDTLLASRNFKYVVASEYSPNDRPHYHIVFFGLDWRVCAKMFRECWRYGQVDVKPVKAGCFRYILDYVQKSYNPLVRHEMFDTKGLDRPFLYHSQHMLDSLIKRQLDFILTHNYCYKTKNNKLRPIPQYYMRKYCLVRPDSTDGEKKSSWIKYFPNKPFNFKEYNKFRQDLARIRNENMTSVFRYDKKMPCFANEQEYLAYKKPDVYAYLQEHPFSCRELISALESYIVPSDKEFASHRVPENMFLGDDYALYGWSYCGEREQWSDYGVTCKQELYDIFRSQAEFAVCNPDVPF